MKRLAISLLLLFSTFAYGGEKVLYSFQGGADGADANGGLIFDSAGNLYGVTAAGGDVSCHAPDGCGTVFELSPDGQGGWTKTVLYTFEGGADGQDPLAALTLDSQGNVYGTTIGSSDDCPPSCGSAFELSPRSGGWTFRVLHAFSGGKDGGLPHSGLTMDGAGNLYGTTNVFGIHHVGTVYRLSNNQNRKFTTLHAFADGADGSTPKGTLAIDQSGTIYGTTLYGGDTYGVLFSLSENAKGKWIEKVLWAFASTKDCGNPVWGLSADQQGSLYCISGPNYASDPSGRLFRFSRNTKGKWSKKTIFSFQRRSSPAGTVLVDPAGKIYATTSGGGEDGQGAVIQLTPQHNGKFSAALLYSFHAKGDGGFPTSPVIMDANGNFYGEAASGGAFGHGVVYDITP